MWAHHLKRHVQGSRRRQWPWQSDRWNLDAGSWAGVILHHWQRKNQRGLRHVGIFTNSWESATVSFISRMDKGTGGEPVLVAGLMLALHCSCHMMPGDHADLPVKYFTVCSKIYCQGLRAVRTSGQNVF